MAAASVAADLAAVTERVRRSTVEVHGAGGAVGAGVVWREGLIVTNAHVVRRPVRLVTADGRLLGARLVAWDRERDLAALAVDPRAGPVAATAGDPRALRVGDLVVAVGHPGGVAGALTVGVVHALVGSAGSRRGRWVQADLRLAPGNSGGPLADARGRVVGVNAMIVDGLAVAIASDVVAAFVADLRRPASLLA